MALLSRVDRFGAAGRSLPSGLRVHKPVHLTLGHIRSGEAGRRPESPELSASSRFEFDRLTGTSRTFVGIGEIEQAPQRRGAATLKE